MDIKYDINGEVVDGETPVYMHCKECNFDMFFVKKQAQEIDARLECANCGEPKSAFLVVNQEIRRN